MASNPTGFKIHCGNTYPAASDSFYDFDDIFVRRDVFKKGGLWVWGSGLGGQLGNDLTTSRSSPVQTCISGNSWRKICLSKHDGHFAVALTTTGQVWVWGCNDAYQIGDGTSGDSLCPKKVVGAEYDDIKLISAGGAGATLYSPGLDSFNTDYGIGVATGGITSAEPCRLSWGCVEGGRSGRILNESTVRTYSDYVANATVDTIRADRQWTDISLGNRFGVGLIDYQCLWACGITQQRCPGTLLEWGVGAPRYVGVSNTINSICFNGTSDYLVVNAGSTGAFNVGTANNILVEGWFYTCIPCKTSFPQIIFDNSPTSSNGSSIRLLSDNKLAYSIGTTNYITSTYPVSANRWNHFALERSSSSTRLYLNGTTIGANSTSINWNTTDVVIGGSGFNRGVYDGYFCGFISSLRVVKGSVYPAACTSNYTIPANPLSLIANTTLLVQHTSTISDATANNLAITINGTSCIVTGQKYSVPLDMDPTYPFAYGLNPLFQVSNDSWKSVSAGNSHALAIKCDGTLWAWGCNDKGQLGTGDTVNRSCPTQIGTANTWTYISAGCNFSSAIRAGCFRSNAAVVFTWGENVAGQLGINTTTNRSSPTQILSECTNWRKISAGDSHLAGVQTDGTIWTWGSNQSGELGRNDRINRSSPVQVAGNTTGWYDVSAGQCATAGLREDAW